MLNDELAERIMFESKWLKNYVSIQPLISIKC